MNNHVGMPYQTSPQNTAQVYDLGATDRAVVQAGSVVYRDESGNFQLVTAASQHIFGIVGFSATALTEKITIFTTGTINARLGTHQAAIAELLSKYGRGVVEEEIDGYTTTLDKGLTVDVEELCGRVRLY